MALDTTVAGGSVALVTLSGTECDVDERGGDRSRTHAERLPAELAAVLAAHGLGWADIDLFAVASGPGSFTGLRIGIATIQGLALTTSRPVVTVSALEALAQAASRDVADGGWVAAWMDAHRGEVFAALYQVRAAPVFDVERLVELEAPTAGDPIAILDALAHRWAGAPVWFVGDGVALYAPHIERAWPFRAGLLAPPLLAGAIGRMALARAKLGDTLHPSAVRPLYVRRPDAEADRERKALWPGPSTG